VSDADRRDVLLIGASGLVGGYIARRLGDAALGTFRTQPRAGCIRLDITDARETREVIARVAPRVVLHCAAWTHVDGCEADPERSYAVNVEGVRNVAVAAGAHGARVIFFSTDYVFGGDEGPHRLEETPAPLNVYGRHKLEAEGIVAKAVADYAIVRSCNLYGYQPGGKNFVMAVVEHGRARKPMRIPSDQWGNPTLAEDLAEASAMLVSSSVRGMFHLAGPDYVDRPTWARRVAEAFGFDSDFLSPVPTSELKQAARRPLKAGLESGSSEARLGLAFRNLVDGLAAIVPSAILR
jgi:dTDP-4-dehydrorhamnose reductase